MSGVIHLMMEEEEREELEIVIADALGISHNDLLLLKPDIQPNENQEGIVHGYNIYFDKNSPKEILDEINKTVENHYVYLTLSELFYDQDYIDQYYEQFQAIISNDDYYENFKTEIENIRELNDLVIENDDLYKIQIRLLYVAIIGVLETFLSDTFINQIKENKIYYSNFLKTFPDFKKEKISLSEILNTYENLDKKVYKAALDVIYHNLPIVREMYKSTFIIDFPDIRELSKAVNKRHDLVHRNGKNKEGEIVIVTKDEVEALLNEVLDFGKQIALKLKMTFDYDTLPEGYDDLPF